jgi:hypothetical protein
MDEKEAFESDVVEIWRELTGGSKVPRKYNPSIWTVVWRRMKLACGDDFDGKSLDDEEMPLLEEASVNEERSKAFKK